MPLGPPVAKGGSRYTRVSLGDVVNLTDARRCPRHGGSITRLFHLGVCHIFRPNRRGRTLALRTCDLEHRYRGMALRLLEVAHEDAAHAEALAADWISAASRTNQESYQAGLPTTTRWLRARDAPT